MHALQCFREDSNFKLQSENVNHEHETRTICRESGLSMNLNDMRRVYSEHFKKRKIAFNKGLLDDEEEWYIRLELMHKKMLVVQGTIRHRSINFLFELEKGNRSSYETK